MLSPATRFTAKRPPSTLGRTASITARMRPSSTEAQGRGVWAVADLGMGHVFKDECGQWWQSQAHRMRSAMESHGRGFDTTQVAPARATKFAGVAVDHFTPEAGQWHAEHVIGAWHRRHIADDQQGFSTLTRLAQEGENAGVSRVGLHPFKSGGREVQLVEGRQAAVHAVKLRHVAL